MNFVLCYHILKVAPLPFSLSVLECSLFLQVEYGSFKVCDSNKHKCPFLGALTFTEMFLLIDKGCLYIKAF